MDQLVSDCMVSSTLINVGPKVNKFTDWYIKAVLSNAEESCLVAGSISELYIEPPLPCVADADCAYEAIKHVAVQSLSQMPCILRLPSTYADNVNVGKIVASQYPGYVKLKHIGELHKQLNGTHHFTQSTDDDDTVFIISRDKQGMKAANVPHHITTETWTLIGDISLSFEHVWYIRCLSWPQQCAEWSTRQRKYNWPHNKTIERIVRRGCDFVQIAHRQCQHDELARNWQWRMSFSRAETVLLNSWTPIQQIVYHMLRTVLKVEGLTDAHDSSGCRIVSRYHVKALMLWFCELKDLAWWTRFNVVVLSSKCLQMLWKCCVAGHCPGYFITDHNLFECDVNSVRLHAICKRMSLLSHVVNLTEWFLNNYIGQCSPEYPRLFHDMNTEGKIFPAVITDYQMSSSFERLKCYLRAQSEIIVNISPISETALNKLCQLLDVDHNLFYYCLSSVCLFLSTKLNETNWFEVMNNLAKPLNCNSCLTDSCDVMSIQFGWLIETALGLMSSVHSVHESDRYSRATNCIKLFLSRLYLCRALFVAEQDSEQCVVRIYLAVLYYIAGDYQNAVEQCTKASSLNCRSHIIEGQLLPKFDDNIDTVSGLVILYQYVQTMAWTSQLEQQQQSVKPVYNVFNAMIFSLFIQCKSCVHAPTLHNQRYQDLTERSIKQCNASDLVLYFIVCHSTNETRQFSCENLPAMSLDFGVNEARQLLVMCGVEQLTMYHQLMASEFSSVDLYVATTDIQALFDFKSGLYERCLLLSEQNVNSLWSQSCNYLQVVLSRCMSTVLDDDLASVVGLINASCKIFRQAFIVSVFQLTLSLYLLIQCRIKLKHSTTPLLVDELHAVRELHDIHSVENNFDRLLLNFAYSRLVIEIRTRDKSLTRCEDRKEKFTASMT